MRLLLVALVAATSVANIYCLCAPSTPATAACCVSEASLIEVHLGECPPGHVELDSAFFEPNEDPRGSLECGGNVCCVLDDDTEVVDSFLGCEAREGKSFVIEFCPPQCCKRPSGEYVRAPEGDRCDQIPDETDVVNAPTESCDEVCCEIDGLTGKLTRGQCLDASGKVLADAECSGSATTGGPDPTTTTDPTTTGPQSTATTTGPQSSDPSGTSTGPQTTDATSGTAETGSTSEPGGSCKCDDPGVQFTVVSGCQGPQFDDATQPSYCKSVVEFVLLADPATHAFADGEVMGFPDCQVQVDCP